MIDPVLEAFAEYERSVAPAYELIRRARGRLLTSLAGIGDDAVPAHGAWLRHADPTEPNGAEMAVDGAIQHPEQGHPGSAVAPIASDDAAPESEGARAARAAAGPPPSPKEPGTGGGIESPGSVRSGQRERRRHGRRAPAASATAPSTSSSEPVGTPTPASTNGARARDERERSKGPHTCSCGRSFPFLRGLARHQNHSGHSEVGGHSRPEPQALGADVTRDPREIDELCPRGCGRRFRWEPSLNRHASSCEGKKAVA